MVLVVLLGVMALMSGLRRTTLLTLLLLGVGVVPLAWTLVLKDYQRERLVTLLNPQPDLLGAGYHSWQSKIAIGSGGLWGKGLLAGTQSRLSFLPERHTDFIFAVLAEEVGFVGVVLLLCLFGCLLVHGFSIAYRSRDRLGALVATGVVTMLAVQIFLNSRHDHRLSAYYWSAAAVDELRWLITGHDVSVPRAVNECAHAAL